MRAIDLIRGVLSADAVQLLGAPHFTAGVWSPAPADQPAVDELVWEGFARQVDGADGAIEATAAGKGLATLLRDAGVIGEARRTLAGLSAALAERSGISIELMRSNRRDAVAARGRAIFALLARTELNRSNGEAARWLGHDPSSMTYMRRRAEAMIAAEPRVAELVAGLRAWLAGGDA